MQFISSKFTKKIVSLMLMVIMIFSACIPAVAQTQEAVATPVVSTTELTIGETAKLKVGGWNKKVTWSTENEAVATVDAAGLVTAVAEGETVITATARSWFGFFKTTKFNVVVKPFEADVTIEIGETVDIEVGAVGTTTWTTSDEAVATVDNGTVTGVSEGLATITATTLTKKLSFFWFLGFGKTTKTVETFTVEVIAPETPDTPEPPTEQPDGTYSVIFNSNGGSEVVTQTIYEGDTAFCPEAPVKEGFVFGDWYVDEALTEKYDFSTPVTGDITLYASWTQLDVVILIDNGQYEDDESTRVILVNIDYNIALKAIKYSAVSATKTVSDDIRVADADEFSVELFLEDGETVFTVTVETIDGSVFEESVTLEYDSGDTYDSEGTYDVEDERLIEIPVVEDTDGDGEAEIYLVSNILSFTFYSDVSFEDRKAFIEDTLGAEVAGYLNSLDMMQALITGELPLADELGYEGETDLNNVTEDELWEYCELLVEAYSEILEDFDLEYIYTDMSAAITTNDPWNGYSSDDWWLEKIQAYEAWKYNSFFNNDYFRYINVGVVDNGFMDNHEDLSGRLGIVSKRDDAADHGTHVAGIIGATSNNDRGISGVLYNLGTTNNGNIFAYDATSSKSFSDSQILEGLTTTVESGAKVINFSIGASGSIADGEYTLSASIIKSQGKKFSKAIRKLLNEGYDFVVVQSAGNGNHGGVGVDYRNNLGFCAINESNCYQPLVGGGNISKSDIMNRIIVVAAVNNDNSLTEWSNGGSGELNIIAAPGASIYSTVSGGGYDYKSGTSMAAPIVTAVCAMTWSINSELTGAEVVDIVMSNTVGTATTNGASHTTGGMGIVNLLECTEAAIETRSQYNGNIIDAVTGEDVEATIVIHKGDKTGPVVGEEGIYYTDSYGNFILPELAALGNGTYTFEISAENYITAYVSVNKFSSYDLGTIGISPVMDEDIYRIVLRWGSVQPSDLDSHLVAETLEGERYHVYYQDKNPYPNYANLDLDDTTYEGPETVTIVNFAESKNIKYAIHDYSNRHSTNSTVMSNSDAYVEVFKGSESVAKFYVPENVGGTEWVVFAFDASGRIIPINEMRYCEDPGYVLAN